MSEPVVEVHVENAPAETPEAPAVVVVDDAGSADAVAMAVGEHTARLAELERENAELRSRIESAEATASVATEIALSASETASEAVEEAEESADEVEAEPEPAPEPEPESEPDREHPFHKKLW